MFTFSQRVTLLELTLRQLVTVLLLLCVPPAGRWMARRIGLQIGGACEHSHTERSAPIVLGLDCESETKIERAARG